MVNELKEETYRIAEKKQAVIAAIEKCTIAEEIPAVVTRQFVNQADNPLKMAKHLELAIYDTLEAMGLW